MADTHWLQPSPPPPPASPPPPSYHTSGESRPVSPVDTITSLTQRENSPTRHCTSSSSVHLPTPNSSAGLLSHYEQEEVVLPWQPSEPTSVVPQSTTYSFSQFGYQSMLLLPPETSNDSRPLYHISVEINCFRPASHITVIRRGASESGAYVGEFEIGVPSRLNRVTIGPAAKMLARPTLAWDHNRSRGELPRLRWNFDDTILHWDPQDKGQAKVQRHFKCTLPGKRRALKVHIASFYPADPLRAVEGARAMPTLTVEREGQHLMDHILVTALILQQDDYFNN